MSKKNENIDNSPNYNLDYSDVDEEEIKPIPELSDEEEFITQDYKDQNKNDNEKNNENKENKDNKDNKENIILKENLDEEDKTDYFPINFLISNEEINSININFDNNTKLNNDSNNNNNKGKSKNKFSFLTNIAQKIKEKISNQYISKEDNVSNNYYNNNIEENNNFKDNKSFEEEEDEFEEMEEHLSYFEDLYKDKLGQNNQNINFRLSGIKENIKKIDKVDDNSMSDSFHSLYSSLNQNIENTIEEIIINDGNKQDGFMKQMLVETSKHYIKEQRQQFEKLQEWGLKVIINILLSNKIRIAQNAFYLIKYSRMSLKKNKERIFFKYYQKYRKKVKNEFIKKFFTKFKIKTIELKPREERIFELIKGLNIKDNNLENIKKIEKIIKEKILSFNKTKEEENNNIIKEKELYCKVEKNKLKPVNRTKEEPNNINQNKEKKEEKKLYNIDNNTSETETTNSSIPPPLPPPLIQGVPIIIEKPLPPGVPIPPMFTINAIPDPTKNIPKLPKGFISRKFQWQKVDYINYKKSFWKEIEEEQEKAKNPFKIDYDLLQKIFTYEKITKKTQTKIENENHKKKEEKISILDSKRLLNMSISLSKIKMTKEKLESLIRVYDIDNILDIETIKSILYFYPKEDEKNALLNYNDDIQKLTYPDQFCKMLISIENCQKILTILLFKKQLSGKISNMLLQIKVLKDAIMSINNSEQFKSILFILRQIGNYLNCGTSVGKAFGFSINSLSKLDNVKGINKEKTSLLEIFITILKKDNPGLINFYKDFKKLEESKNCIKEEIDKNITDLKIMINKILKEKETKNEEYLEFINNVENYSMAKMDCIDLSDQFLNDEIDKTILIFGENKSQFNINDFIKNIRNFVNNYKTCSLEISKRESRMLKKKILEDKKKKDITIINNDLLKICDNTKKIISKKVNINDIEKDKNFKTQSNSKRNSQEGESQIINKTKNDEIVKDNNNIIELNIKYISSKEKNKIVKKKIKENNKGDNSNKTKKRKSN